MIEGMQRDASMIFEKPIRYSGVEIPQTTKISLFGNDIKIGINSLARALQFGIAPLLLLWLASLYNTRIRETIAIKDSELISEVFPHVINLYPSGRVLPPRKKSLIKSTAPKIISTLYFISRSILLLAFILPPTASYIYGLYLLSTDDYGAVFILLGALVLMFAFFNILVELLPWHFSKFFPSPIDN